MRPAGLPTAITDFVEQWGYLALVAGVALGLPVPEDVWLAAGGYLAWAGLLSFRWVVFVGVAGAVTADNLGYWIGRLGRRRLLDRFGRYVLVTPARLRQAEAFFLRPGSGPGPPAARPAGGRRRDTLDPAGRAGHGRASAAASAKPISELKVASSDQ